MPPASRKASSAIYGSSAMFDNRWILAAFFLFEALIDTFPRQLVRNLSSQIIGLYKLDVGNNQ
jgi:hypothetical protein